MRVGVLGINHRLAGIRVREAIAKACQKFFGSDKITHVNHAFVLLSTCNRTEIYFSSDDPAATHSYILQLLREEIAVDFEQKIYSFFGYDCFFHLARVAAGLDSAILGETEIQGQVRLCYEKGCDRKLPGELHFIFQKSLRIAKNVRTHCFKEFGRSSLEYAMWQICQNHSLVQPRILFVGASQVNQKNLWYFQRKNYGKLWICNRTDEKAYAIAADLSIGYLPWNQLDEWQQFDVVCCATKSSEHLIQPNSKANTALYFDLSVPRNITPQPQHEHIYDIDQLQKLVRLQQTHLEEAAEDAHYRVAEATLYHMKSRQKRRAPEVAELVYA